MAQRCIWHFKHCFSLIWLKSMTQKELLGGVSRWIRVLVWTILHIAPLRTIVIFRRRCLHRILRGAAIVINKLEFFNHSLLTTLDVDDFSKSSLWTVLWNHLSIWVVHELLWLRFLLIVYILIMLFNLLTPSISISKHLTLIRWGLWLDCRGSTTHACLRIHVSAILNWYLLLFKRVILERVRLRRIAHIHPGLITLQRLLTSLVKLRSWDSLWRWLGPFLHWFLECGFQDLSLYLTLVR